MKCHCSRWFAMSSPKDPVNQTITPSVCLMFQVLAERLHQLQELLSVPLFSTAWQTLAKDLNQVCSKFMPHGSPRYKMLLYILPPSAFIVKLPSFSVPLIPLFHKWIKYEVCQLSSWNNSVKAVFNYLRLLITYR